MSEICVRPCTSLTLGAFVLLLLPPLPISTFADSCWITRNGESHAAIVSPVPRSGSLSAAIGDLQLAIRRMSGADLAVSDQPRLGHHSLILLTEADLRASGVPQPVPVDLSALRSLNEEGFLIRVREGQAWLVGRTELGLQHAVYWLLEQWGCRWLFPGEAGEVIPSAASLTVTPAMETAQQPRFLMRALWYSYGRMMPEQIRMEHRLWIRRNRLEYSLTGSIGHAYSRIVSLRDEDLFKSNPELFPIENGRPVRKGQLATENPLVRQRAVEYAFKYFAQSPEARMVSMSPNDGGGPWKTKDGRHARFSDAALDLANYVASTLQQNPQTSDKKVAMYAYYDTANPPSIQAERNVVIFIATRFTRTPWKSLVLSWAQKASIIGIRDYASIIPWNMTRPTWGLERLKDNVRFWDSNKVVGVSTESGNDWGGWGLYHYVLARLLWNPEEKMEVIVDDFLQRGFGPAAGDMRKYFLRWKPAYNSEARNAAIRDINSALGKTKSTDVRRRIELYGLYLHHLRLLDACQYHYAGVPGRKALLKELVRFDSRLASTNMAHTIPLAHRYLRDWAIRQEKVGEGEYESWKSDEPFSQREIEQVLREDLLETCGPTR